jgi:hypothetical protein
MPARTARIASGFQGRSGPHRVYLRTEGNCEDEVAEATTSRNPPSRQVANHLALRITLLFER